MSDAARFMFACPDCGHRIDLPSSSIGRSIVCPRCQKANIARPQPAGGNGTGRIERPTARIEKPTTARLRRTVGDATVPGSGSSLRPITTEFTAPAKPPTASRTKPQTRSVVNPDLSAIPAATRVATPLAPIPSPLPGAVRVTTDRVPSPLPECVEFDAEHAGPTVEFSCGACSAHLLLPSSYAGKVIRCPKCAAAQRVASLADAPEPMATTRSISKRMRTVEEGKPSGEPPTVRSMTPRPATAPRVPPAQTPPATAPVSTGDTDFLGGAPTPPPVPVAHIPPPQPVIYHRPSVPLLIATGIFGVTTIGFAALSVYAMMALRATQARVAQLEHTVEARTVVAPPTAAATAAPVR